MQLQIDDVQKNIDALNQSRELVHSKYVFLSGGAGKKKKIDSKVGSPNNQNRPKQASGKNLIQILKDADPDASKEEIDKFVRFVTELLSYLNLYEDPMYEIVEALRKIESNLMYYSEARNLMVERQQRLPLSKRLNEDDIETFEIKQDKLRKDQRMAALKIETERKQEEAKEKQREKAQKMIEFNFFKGKRDQFRSVKKQFKPLEVKVDNMSQQTKDEKEYLDPELFTILQNVKGAIDRGDFDEHLETQPMVEEIIDEHKSQSDD